MSNAPSTAFAKRPPRSPSKLRRRGKRVKATEEQPKLYGKYAGVYDILCGYMFRRGRKLAIHLLDVRPGDRVLEVGVGTGLSFKYYPRLASITGIDVSPQMLQEARVRLAKLGRTDIDVREGDAMKLAFPDASFDKVLASHVLSAVPDPHAAWREIKRVCAPGGVIAISNRFGSELPMVRAAEKAMTPFTRKLGFILDLPLELLTQDPILKVETIRKVSAPLWHVIVLRKLHRAER